MRRPTLIAGQAGVALELEFVVIQISQRRRLHEGQQRGVLAGEFGVEVGQVDLVQQAPGQAQGQAQQAVERAGEDPADDRLDRKSVV